MPALGNHLNFAQYEARNVVVHNGNPNPPSGNVKGQLWFNNVGNELFYWDGTIWQSAKSGVGSSGPPNGPAGGVLAGNYPNPTHAPGVIVDADINASAGIAKSKLAALNIANADVAAGAAIQRSKLDFGTGLVNTDLAAAAAIARSKLDFGTGLVNADLAAAAAIAYSKLALTNTILNADINASAAIAWSKINSALAIVNADVNASAGIVYSKLSLANGIVNADINTAAGIALSKLATDPLARANHTGTQLAATISNFDTQVRTSRLDQMAIPSAPVAMNGQKITGMADGTAATDAATKGQIDALVTGLDVKGSCRVAASATVTIASPGATIDGVTMVSGDRVLLLAQGGAVTTPHLANGIYVWNGAAVPMTRATDADTSAEVTAGLFTFVSEGTVADSGWYLMTNNPITLNTTALQFVQFSGAGQVTAGAGLTKTGNTLDVVGTANRITAAADAIDIASNYAGQATITTLGTITAGIWQGTDVAVADGGTGASAAPAARTNLGAAGYYSSATHGAGTTITITAATHGCRASRGLIVQVQEEGTGLVVLPDTTVAANGDVTVTFGASVAANAYRVTVIG